MTQKTHEKMFNTANHQRNAHSTTIKISLYTLECTYIRKVQGLVGMHKEEKGACVVFQGHKLEQ